MSIRKVNFVAGEYYHIYNRGNSKQVIFNDQEDYKHFVDLMYICNSKQNIILRYIKNFYLFHIDEHLVSIGAYCLMPNHFHILITQTEDGSISKFMQKLTTAYSMYYNKKYQRTGSLFEGKFKSQHLKNDKYLKYIFSYIHLNPVKIIQKDWKEKGIQNKIKATDFLEKYKYSSYLDYINFARQENKILNYKDFPNYFKSKNNFKKEIFEWLSYGEIA